MQPASVSRDKWETAGAAPKAWHGGRPHPEGPWWHWFLHSALQVPETSFGNWVVGGREGFACLVCDTGMSMPPWKAVRHRGDGSVGWALLPFKHWCQAPFSRNLPGVGSGRVCPLCLAHVTEHSVPQNPSMS